VGASVDPGNVFADILEGAIVGAILIPVFQKVIREILFTAPQPEGATFNLILLTVNMMPLLPVVETIIGFGVAYEAGRWGGLVGYILGVLGASALFGAPKYAISLFIGGFVVFTVAILLHSGGSGGMGRTGRF
jgi:hypothetical protein